MKPLDIASLGFFTATGPQCLKDTIAVQNDMPGFVNNLSMRSLFSRGISKQAAEFHALARG